MTRAELGSCDVPSLEDTLGSVLLATARREYGSLLGWRAPPYEYEHSHLPIDIISGGRALREAIDQGLRADTLDELCDPSERLWWDEVDPFLLYESASA